MKEIKEYEKDLASIRTMMERSAKFISLSGLSGVLAGFYALIGAGTAYFLVYYPDSLFQYRTTSILEPVMLIKLLVLAAFVLVASVATGLWLSFRKAKKHDVKLWNATSQNLVISLSIPLVTGGLFILALLYHGHYGIAAPASLIFYGLALIQGSSNTYDEVRYLGFSEILLGLIGSVLPGYGLLFWALGFGVLHVVYGAIMHNKYDR